MINRILVNDLYKDKEKLKVSIITPIFNRFYILERALIFVENQIICDIEHVMITQPTHLIKSLIII